MTSIIKWLLALALVVIVIGYLRRVPSTDPIVLVAADDPQMLAAIAEARASQGEFLTRLRNPPTTQSSASVKVMLRDEAETEHVWLQGPRYEDGFFVGTLGNEPQIVTRYALGDMIRVPESDMSDWLAIDDGVLVGGFSSASSVIVSLQSSGPSSTGRALSASSPASAARSVARTP